MIEGHEERVTSTEKAYFVGSGPFQLPLFKFLGELWIRPPANILLGSLVYQPGQNPNP